MKQSNKLTIAKTNKLIIDHFSASIIFFNTLSNSCSSSTLDDFLIRFLLACNAISYSSLGSSSSSTIRQYLRTGLWGFWDIVDSVPDGHAGICAIDDPFASGDIFCTEAGILYAPGGNADVPKIHSCLNCHIRLFFSSLKLVSIFTNSPSLAIFFKFSFF